MTRWMQGIAAAMAAVTLSGCVVYPAGHHRYERRGPPPRYEHDHRHDRDRDRYDDRGRGRGRHWGAADLPDGRRSAGVGAPAVWAAWASWAAWAA